MNLTFHGKTVYHSIRMNERITIVHTERAYHVRLASYSQKNTPNSKGSVAPLTMIDLILDTT